MARRLQVFVSSTYLDLKEERQAAVEAILEAKHIPAGMELFAAGNESQLKVIKKWIDESDVYMLILGHRYGSIEPESGKSYTQVEFDYAVSTGKPVFSVVMTDGWRKTKQAGPIDANSVIEFEHSQKLKEFRGLVNERLWKQADDRKDIKIAVLQSLAEFAHDKSLVGWVRGDADDKRQELEKEIAGLKGELAAAKRQNTALEGRLAKAKGGEAPNWEATRAVLEGSHVDLTEGLSKRDLAQLPQSEIDHMKRSTALTALVRWRHEFFRCLIYDTNQGPLRFALANLIEPTLDLYGLTEDGPSDPENHTICRRLSQRGRAFLIWLDQKKLTTLSKET